MRVEFAEPGVDPTRMRSEVRHGSSRLADLVRGNGLLIVGCVLFLAFTGWQFGWFESTPEPDPVVVAAVTEAAPTAAPTTAGYCLYLDTILIPHGDTVNVGGTREVSCMDGEVLVSMLAGAKP